MGSLAYITPKCGRFSRILIQQVKCISSRKFFTRTKHVSFNANGLIFQNKVEFRWPSTLCQRFSSAPPTQKPNDADQVPEKQTKWQLLKKMYTEYWYIIVPVHLVTSVGWLSMFYLTSTSGADIISKLELIGISESLITQFRLRDSSMGHYAVTYALYKIFTPLRYTVTLGGTTFAIDYLKKRGYIKPVPNKNAIKEIIGKKKDEFTESIRETKAGFKQRKNNIADDYVNYRAEMKKVKNTRKTMEK